MHSKSQKNGEGSLPVTLGLAQSEQFPPEQKQIENKNLKRITKITYPALALLALPCFALSPTAAGKPPPPAPAPNPNFVYKDGSGKKQSVEVVDKYCPKEIVDPFAKVDSRIDPKLRRAATIAEERAHAHSL